MIAVLDYGIGNLRSAQKALAHLGADARLVSEPAATHGADGVVLPGVGAFGACARALSASGLHEVVLDAVRTGVPVLGLCVGFQLFFEGSQESPGERGLGLIGGTLRVLPAGVKRPQMQWNRTHPVAGRDSALLAPFAGELAAGQPPWFYYVHSYAAFPEGEAGDACVATCDYGVRIVSAVERGGIVRDAVPPREVRPCGPCAARRLRGVVRAQEIRHRCPCRRYGRPGQRGRGGLMELLPAVDVLAGSAVRLTRGDFASVVEYGDPVARARAYAEGGSRWVHVVDLAAARSGEPASADLVAALLAALEPFGARMQLGGGVRDAGRAEALLAAGVARVVLGTAALERADLVEQLATAHPGRIAVGLDHRVVADAGRSRTRVVAVAGWERNLPVGLLEAAARFESLPLGALVVTDIGRDGMLGGPDLAGYGELLAATSLPVVASGGVGSREDLAALAALEVAGRRLAGVVVGKALLDGRLSLPEALAACAGTTSPAGGR